MKHHKISQLLILLVLFGCLCLPAAAAPAVIQVTVDGSPVAFPDARPYLDSNRRTLVPLRAAADAMGLDVEWNAATKTATFTRCSRGADGVAMQTQYVSFTVGSAEVPVEFDTDQNGMSAQRRLDHTLYMDTAAVITANRTYAPSRYLAEAFGYVANWQASMKTVEILPADLHLAVNAWNGTVYLSFFQARGYTGVASATIDLYEGTTIGSADAFVYFKRFDTEETAALPAAALQAIARQNKLTTSDELLQVYRLDGLALQKGKRYTARISYDLTTADGSLVSGSRDDFFLWDA